jgi:hypothetical protein
MDNLDIFQVILITARKLDKSKMFAPGFVKQFKDVLRSISSPLLNFYSVNTGRNIFYAFRIRDRIKINIMN